MSGTKRRSYDTDNDARNARRRRQHERMSSEPVEPSEPQPVSPHVYYAQKLAEVARDYGYEHEYKPLMSVLMNPNDYRNQPLYPGAHITVIQAVTLELHSFAKHPGSSKAQLSERFWNDHHFKLPRGNKMPASMDEAEKMIKDLLLTKKECEVCPNDCMAYRKEYAGLESCPVCGTQRYKPGTKIPKKKFFFFPIIPWVRQMFEIPSTARAVQSHWPRPRREDGIVRDLHDSPAWEEIYGPGGKFHGENYCLQFEFSADGLNPYNILRSSYSMWPASLKILNLPPSLRNKVGMLKLVLVIPGPREPKNINTFMGPVMDDFETLKDGVWMWNAHLKRVVKVRAELMLNVMDYPGQSKCGKSKNAGAISACNKCWFVGTYSKPLSKVIYVGHRRLLPLDHKLRDAPGFPEASPETRGPPLLKTREEMLVYGQIYDSAETPALQNLVSRTTGKLGVEQNYRLETHGPEKFAPEMMHHGADAIQKVYRMITGEDDTRKVRLAEQENKRFPETWPVSSTTTQRSSTAKTAKGKKKSVTCGSLSRIADSRSRPTPLPEAGWRLTKAEKSTADNRIVTVKEPVDFGFKPKRIFAKYDYLKSHDWKQLATEGIMKYSLRDLLGNEQRRTLFKLCDVLGALTYPIVRTDKIADIQLAVDECLAQLERDYPSHVMVTVIHQLTHQPAYLARYGPAREYWMFIFEQLMHVISSRVTNKRYPEASMVEAYMISEFCKAMAIAEVLPKGAISTDLQRSVLSCPAVDDGTATFQLTKKKRAPEFYELSLEQQEELTRFHMATNRRFTSMYWLLQKERDKSGSRQPLKEWTPSRALSEVEREVIEGPSRKATKFFVAERCIYGRLTEYRCEEVEARSRQRSSFVGKNIKDKGPCFGRIQFFIRHEFMEQTTDLAYVKWLPRAERDEETSLFVIDANLPSPQHQPFLALEDLSDPLVTATDPEDGLFWVLNFDNVLVGQ